MEIRLFIMVQVAYTVLGPIGQLRDYFFVASQQEGSPGERVDIMRRFDQKEDRDAFESLLQKTGFAPFSIQPIWSISVHGAPCLAVSSAPVYTLQEMMGGQFPSLAVQDNVIITFFQQNHFGYPGKWESEGLWKGLGKYKDLRLFDLDGNFVIDPEGLIHKRLLYDEFKEFKKYGDVLFYQKAKKFRRYRFRYEDKDKQIQWAMGHIKSNKLRVSSSSPMFPGNQSPLTALQIPPSHSQ
ncbi:hypothetical protein GYMLUDRAFT_410396 [Collybiopsis luxurians FD-317 M1]|uniref:Uncharacterized protein n=1 Tax=Collybiopsis luxurians FD-317 M1 TaxID=944289 RepID=A0A0D0C099_9AGAR|nr:hypothetical protein GYMLUDRAFT_410396 [Collybiopsis luxurians FD-317 M1]